VRFRTASARPPRYLIAADVNPMSGAREEMQMSMNRSSFVATAFLSEAVAAVVALSSPALAHGGGRHYRGCGEHYGCGYSGYGSYHGHGGRHFEDHHGYRRALDYPDDPKDAGQPGPSPSGGASGTNQR